MPQTNRRKFLSLLGVGVVASPLAAKQVLDESIAKQGGINLLGAAGTAYGYGPGAPSQPPSESNYLPYEDKIKKVVNYVKVFGLPDFLHQDFKQRSSWVDRFDPDIACKRSWSLSVKIQEQRARNYQRALNEFYNQGSILKDKSIVSKILGFAWPW